MRTTSMSNYQEAALAMIEKFGPDEYEYPVINNLINSITDEAEGKAFRELMMPVLTGNSLYGYTYQKPLGYAGDFMLIEKMYQTYVSSDPSCRKWDIYYHTHEATKAVRNRKFYFVRLMEELCANKPGPLNILILGSGPTTDVHEFFTRNPQANTIFDCLDIDQRAIDYASEKNKKYLSNINFIKMNVLRFMPNKKYDLIWSAGLFDYLNDRLFTGLLGRFKTFLKPNGQMIIGNFSTENPTQRVMEVMGEWFLNHRSSKHLVRLASFAGISEEMVYVDKEPLGINLFLKINASQVDKLYHIQHQHESQKSKAGLEQTVLATL
jgi:extracellular factor (EF) 3-hydroxypalmitic acid methyl ester biosynthesis protein